jgi:hypothetical protein
MTSFRSKIPVRKMLNKLQYFSDNKSDEISRAFLKASRNLKGFFSIFKENV